MQISETRAMDTIYQETWAILELHFLTRPHLMTRAQEELAEVVGRPVDLLTRYVVDTDPNWLFRKSVLSRTERLYAR